MNRIQTRSTLLKLISGISVPQRLEHWELDALHHEGGCELGRRGMPVLWRAAATLTTDGEAFEYPLPLNFQSFLELEPVTMDGTPLTPATSGQLTQLRAGLLNQTWDGTSTCIYYETGIQTSGLYIGRRLLGFYPTPVADLVIGFPYQREPTKLSELTDNVVEYWDMPSRYHRVPCLWGAKVWSLDNESQLTKDPAIIEAEFDRYAHKFRVEFNEKMQPNFRATTPEAFSSLFGWECEDEGW